MEDNHMNKTEYLATIFNRRTKNKNYENFIVNAIYTLIGNKELIPVTQQYVQLDKKGGDYAFLDLYFPQINYGIEIDERHHLDKLNKLNDEERALAIASTIKCKEGRIAVYNPIGELRKYEDIYKDILKQVKIIKNKIKNYEKSKKLIWEDNDKLKEGIFKRGFFDVNDQVDYKNITEIYNKLGHNVEKLSKCYVKLNKEYKLWVPFLAIKLEDGSVITKNGWENIINKDMTEIVEIPQDKDNRNDTRNLKSGAWNDNGIKRVVFMQMRECFGKTRRKCLGVFEAYKIENKAKKQYRYYRRIETNFNFRKILFIQ